MSEHDKVKAVIEALSSYSDAVALYIKLTHLNQNCQDNTLEAFVKNILTRVCSITTSQQINSRSAWSVYLLQQSSFEILRSILETYADGIKTSLLTGKSQIFIQDDLFTIGKVILQNLITFETTKHGVDSNQSIKGIC